MKKLLPILSLMTFLSNADPLLNTSESSPPAKGVNSGLQLSILLPTTPLTIKTKQLEIPYSYALNGVGTTDLQQMPEIRITFNLLNSNCYAYRILKAKYQQAAKGAVITQKCQIDSPGTYTAYATICLKTEAATGGPSELCKTAMGNLEVK